MTSVNHLLQVVNSLGREITVIDESEIERTEKAKISVEQASGGYGWESEFDLNMETRVLTMLKSSDVSMSSIFEFEGKTWWPADMREIQDRRGDVTGYRILALETGVGEGENLSDGTDEVEIVHDGRNENPGELKRGEIEIPGADENNLQDLGKANEVTNMVAQIGRWTRVNGSRENSIESVEGILESWHNSQEELSFTTDNSTSTVLLKIKNFQRFEEAEIVLAEISLVEV